MRLKTVYKDNREGRNSLIITPFYSEINLPVNKWFPPEKVLPIMTLQSLKNSEIRLNFMHEPTLDFKIPLKSNISFSTAFFIQSLTVQKLYCLAHLWQSYNMDKILMIHFFVLKALFYP